MKFKALPVTSLEDATLDLEQLQVVLNTGILQLAVSGTGRKIAIGTATLTWPGGSVDSGQAVVAHGLGVVPVISGGWQVSAGTFGFRVAVTNNAAATSSNLTLAATSLDGTPAASSASVQWFAIG